MLLKVANKQEQSQSAAWEFTPDGFLRCNTVRILKECVMPYGLSEFEELPESFDKDKIQMYVPKSELTDPEALRSLAGAPVVLGEHNWAIPETVKQYQVGQVAGTPKAKDGYVICELLITDTDAIEKITSGEMPEISAGYLAGAEFAEGEFAGEAYDAKQVGIRYNHIAVIPVGHGRAGTDVKILNTGGNDMSVKVKLARTGRFVNTDEEGASLIAEEAAKADQAVEGAAAEGGESAKNLEATMQALEGKNGELASLQSEIEELKGELSVYKQKLDELLSTEAIEHKALEMNEEQMEAEEIIENTGIKGEKGEELSEDEKVQIKNSLKGIFGENLHRKVLALTGIKCENLSKEGVKVAFKTQHQMIQNMTSKKVVAGQKMLNNKQVEVPAGRTSRQKMGL